jgi:outer membrane protein assembly factor BamB
MTTAGRAAPIAPSPKRISQRDRVIIPGFLLILKLIATSCRVTILDTMLKKLAIAVICVMLVGAGLYLAGFRVALDGGLKPRFLVRDNYSELEADRARQRQLPLAATVVSQQSQAPASAAQVVGAGTPAFASGDAAADKSTGKPDPPNALVAPNAPVAPGTPGMRGYWPDFRGPNRDGRYTETAIRTDWPREGLPRLWKQPIGGGYASFVVADGRAFTIEQRRAQEVVAAYDVETGRELWTNGWNAFFQESLGGDGPRATPTYHEGRVYALGAEGEFRVLDAQTGSVVWRRNILSDNGASNLTWGMAASPLIVDEKVIVLPGGSRGRSVVAYHKLTGEPIWRVLDDQQSYTSPMLVTIAGVRQIIVVAAHRAFGVTPDNGRLLWEYPWSNGYEINVAQPVVFSDRGRDLVFLSASYGQGAAVFQLTRAGDKFEARTLWENQRMKNKFTSSVLHNGYLYGLDESILACIDAATGEQKWKGGRYGYGQIMLAGDHLIVLTEDGDLVLVRATPERHQELASFSAIEGKTWNHPVIIGGRLLVRNIQEMAAFDISTR